MADYEIGYAPSPPFEEHQYRARKALIGSSATLIEKTFTENGEYLATDYDADGFSKANVAVPAPTLITKNITANGDYSASADGVDGYSSVHVEVPPTLFRQMIDKSITTITANDLAGFTKIEEYAFYKCTSLSTVELPTGVTSLAGNAFNGCNKLRRIIFPDSVTQIGTYCFSSAGSSLSTNIFFEAIFSKNSLLATLSTRAFVGSKVKSILLGELLTNIEEGAFRYCYNLSKVVLLAQTPPVIYNSDIFYLAASLKIYVPTPSAYRIATNWVALASSIFPLVSTIADLANIDTTTYTKACVIGVDESYKEYIYDGSQWNEVT